MKKENIIQITIIIALIFILCVLIALYFNGGTNSQGNGSSSQMRAPGQGGSGGPGGQNGGDNSESVEKTGATEFSEEKSESNQSYESTNSDESAILVKDGGNAKISNSTVSKSSGDSSNVENSEFYGVNAGILVTSGSQATLDNLDISTSAKGSNAVFSTGTDSKIYISNSKIETTKDSSRGLDATYGGYIEADNVEISTQGGSCATLATDRGEGTVIAKNSTLSTAGSGSPVIYSTGDITLENSTGKATGAQMVVIEGKNTATVTNSTLECSGKGNRNNVDNCGIMIYQSMSGDAGEGTGTLNATNATLSISSNSDYYKTAPLFFITNTKAIINLENNTLQYGSGILLKAQGTSEWGTSENNGGEVTLNAKNQELTGNIEADNISTVEINLKENSNLNGVINTDNTAKEIKLSLDTTSTLTLTGDTYVTELNDEDATYSNINLNGYKLYVNGTAIEK